MYKQIRAQTSSFIRGFYSILNPDWLAMFSPPELQKLISGDTGVMNVDDLRYGFESFYFIKCLFLKFFSIQIFRIHDATIVVFLIFLKIVWFLLFELICFAYSIFYINSELIMSNWFI